MADADEPAPRLPIKLNPCSNGEYVPPRASPVVREAARLIDKYLGRLERRVAQSSSVLASKLLSLQSLCSCTSWLPFQESTICRTPAKENTYTSS